jgi:hypothetical protein
MRLEVASRSWTSTTWPSCAASPAHRRQVPPAELDICYPLAWGKEGVEACLASLCAEAVDAVKGHNILIVSDRAVGADRGHPGAAGHLGRPPAPGRKGLRTRRPGGRNRLGPRVHHFAVLAGYGAEAVHPTWRWKPWPTCQGCRLPTSRLQLHQGVGKGL